jgi:hypothetical protein
MPSSEQEPGRKPRTNRDQQRNRRLTKLVSGSIRLTRRERWAVRKKIAEVRGSKWPLYALYEHLIDLASPIPSSNQLSVKLHHWELAEDLRVSDSTISRWLRRLKQIGLIHLVPAKSDVSPAIVTLPRPSD